MTTLFIALTLLWPPRSMACVSDDFTQVSIAITGSCPTDYNFLCRYGAELVAGSWTVCCVEAQCHLSTFGTPCAGEHFCDAL